jgi:hypothetical protein
VHEHNLRVIWAYQERRGIPVSSRRILRTAHLGIPQSCRSRSHPNLEKLIAVLNLCPANTPYEDK